MLLKTKALTTALLSGLCVSAMAAAQESRPAGQTPPPAETGVPTPAVGQPDTTATSEAAGKRAAEEEIIVTGSRIRRKDLTTPAPVTVISREQVVASGKVSIGDFLQSLPEQGNAINTSVNNGGDGSTRVSLRGLGAPRTLILLNGRRIVNGGPGADRFFGGYGNDVIDSRDGLREHVYCGPGTDTVKADPRDVVTDCEHVTRRAA